MIAIHRPCHRKDLVITHRRARPTAHAITLVAGWLAGVEAAPLARPELATKPIVGRLRPRWHVDVRPAGRGASRGGKEDFCPIMVVEEAPTVAESGGAAVPAERDVWIR